MNQTILIHDVVEVESIDKTLTDERIGTFGVTDITIKTADGSTIVISLFDAEEVANVAP